MTGVEILPHNADEDEWLAARQLGIGASEIAAVMGISPYDSPFSLFWRKRNGWRQDETEEMSAGKRLEQVVADWFAQEVLRSHEDDATGCVRPTGLWQNIDRPFQLATPDRKVMTYVPGRPGVARLTALLECKAAFSWDGFGESGSSTVPVHYRAQCLWQLDTVGVDKVYLAAFSGLHFRWFVIHRDDTDLLMMREQGRRFMASLSADEPPDVDEHSATLPILRRLHSDIEDREQEIPARIAEGWQRAKRHTALAKRVTDRYTAQLRAELGTAKTAVLAGQRFAARTTNDQLRSAK